MSAISKLGTQARHIPTRAPFVAPTTQHFSAACQRRQDKGPSPKTDDRHQDGSNEEPEQGAMARRLSQMTDDAILEGGRSAHRNIKHAGFSEDLKQQLEERVKAASFKSEHAAAHSILDMPV